MQWRRDRRSRSTLDPAHRAMVWQAVSLLLDYPSEELVDRAALLRSALAEVPERHTAGLTAFLDLLQASPLQDLQADYVDTFDVTRRCALHLTYFTEGDTRKRGVALVRFKQAYRAAGVELDAAELPDHLPVLLEFGAMHDGEVAWRLLNDHRVGIELLARALHQRDSRWAPVLDALRSTLPQLDGDAEVALRRLIAEGPPSEDVGLDTSPYGSDMHMDPALDERLNPRPAARTVTDLGLDIPVGAPR